MPRSCWRIKGLVESTISDEVIVSYMFQLVKTVLWAAPRCINCSLHPTSGTIFGATVRNGLYTRRVSEWLELLTLSCLVDRVEGVGLGASWKSVSVVNPQGVVKYSSNLSSLLTLGLGMKSFNHTFIQLSTYSRPTSIPFNFNSYSFGRIPYSCDTLRHVHVLDFTLVESPASCVLVVSSSSILISEVGQQCPLPVCPKYPRTLFSDWAHHRYGSK